MRKQTWFDALHDCETTGQAYAAVTVLTTAGSTPREGGSKMIITADSTYDTIGGGHLEYKATELARNLLAQGQDVQHIESYPLASKLGQCCGGAMKVLIEVRASHCQTLALFGGGHVAQALVPILAQLPLQIRWYDNRSGLIPDTVLPSNVKVVIDEQVEGEVALLPENSWVVVMTHDHQLDFTLVEKALKRPDLPYVGMIGSDTKAKRFFTRLEHKGLEQQALARLVSPIGELSVNGKRPIEVAVSIAAQIINRLNADSTTQQQTTRINKELSYV